MTSPPIGLVAGHRFGLTFIRMTNNMNTTCNPLRRPMTLSLLSGLAVAVLNLLLASPVPAADATGDMVPLAIKLPAPAFKGTPKDLQLGPKNPEVYVARGGSYHLLGQHEKGFEDRTLPGS